jgi:hypothetical protein
MYAVQRGLRGPAGQPRNFRGLCARLYACAVQPLSSVNSLVSTADRVLCLPGRSAESPSVGRYIHAQVPALASFPQLALDCSSSEALLASLDACLLPEARQSAAEMLQPRLLTSQSFLFGRTMDDAYLPCPEAAQAVWKEAKLIRGDTARAVAGGFAERMRRRAETSASTDRLVNPLVALQSAPGGGKSAMLDLLGLLSARSMWSDDLCPDEAMRDILNTSVPIPIT